LPPIPLSVRLPAEMTFDPSQLPSLLNPEQLEAATHVGSPLLVLAGAGSGKTRVITYRIANLIKAHDVAPWRILAVTFTNKAAGEMKERLEKLLGPEGADVWVSTFHSTGARILRREGEVIGLSKSFVIYDEADSLAEMKRVMKAMGVDSRQIEPRRILHRIDDAKNHGRTPDDCAKFPAYDEAGRLFPELYRRYQKALAAADAVDFGDLLHRMVELFEKAPDVLEKYRHRFRHVLVDEFQDTNGVQFRLLKMLAGDGRGLCVVGDDDQAIYRWRGADVTNLLQFEQEFPGTRIVKLERNYRSTQLILDAAHSVISRNRHRMEKKLWTEREGGDPLELLVARDERHEAQLVADKVRISIRDGVDPNEIAVFYRTNAQSRVIEEAFRLGRIPYHVVRGRSFYDRAEVKDLASFMRLSINPRSDQDALRVINKPARGIGDTTVARIEEAARSWGLSVVEACARADEIPGLNSRAQGKVRAFAQLIGELIQVALAEGAGAVAEAALKKSGMEEAFLADGSDEAIDRLDNVRELVGAAKEWDESWEWEPDPADPGAEPPLPVAAFLEQIALLGEGDERVQGARVSLMTLHAAKGLEFEEVFLTGMEEQVFPHSRALGEQGGAEEIAEERRLCYVGFTRAKRRLVLSLATSRALYGDLRFNPPSRFLGDVPKELFAGVGAAGDRVRHQARVAGGTYVEYDEDAAGPEIDLGDDDGFEDGVTIDYSFDQRPQVRQRHPVRPAVFRRRPGEVVEKAATLPTLGMGGPGAYPIGTPVRHPSFGVGMVEGADGDKLSIRFPGVGVKRVVARFVQPV